MAHFEIDPITFFLKNTSNFPTKTQRNIIDVMDSCEFTLIPYKRFHGITTTLSIYTEWEFLHSEQPIEISFGVLNTHSINTILTKLHYYKKGRGLFKNGCNTIEVDATQSILRSDYMRGWLPSDVYIFDTLDRINEDKLFEFIYSCRSKIGQTITYRLSDLQTTQGYENSVVLYKNIIKTYNGSRFVIVCDDVHNLAQQLLDYGIDSEKIGIVDMSPGPLNINILSHIYRQVTPGLIAQDIVGVQPMIGPAGQIFKINAHC